MKSANVIMIIKLSIVSVCLLIGVNLSLANHKGGIKRLLKEEDFSKAVIDFVEAWEKIHMKENIKSTDLLSEHEVITKHPRFRHHKNNHDKQHKLDKINMQSLTHLKQSDTKEKTKNNIGQHTNEKHKQTNQDLNDKIWLDLPQGDAPQGNNPLPEADDNPNLGDQYENQEQLVTEDIRRRHELTDDAARQQITREVINKTVLYNESRVSIYIAQTLISSDDAPTENGNLIDLRRNLSDSTIAMYRAELERQEQLIGHSNRSLIYGSEENPSTNCTYCMLREEAKRLRLEAIKIQILSKLRMSSPPSVNLTGRKLPKIPPLRHLLQQYEPPTAGMQGDAPGEDYEDDFHARTVTVMNFAKRPPNILNVGNLADICYFAFNANVMNSRVAAGHLWIYIRPSRVAVPPQWTMILIHKLDVPPAGLDSNQAPNMTLVNEKEINLKRSGGWYKFDVKKTLKDWMKQSQDYGLFKIEAYNHEGVSMAMTTPVNEWEKEKMPFLELRIKARTPRLKRSLANLDCDDTSVEERCCRYPLTVDFAEFGWDWVVVPRRYNAYFCAGECQFLHLHRYAHTQLLQQVQQMNPFGSAGPCCTPTKLSTIQMLYYDDLGELIYAKLPGMVVQSCGCA